MGESGVHKLNGVLHLLLTLADEGNVFSKHENPADLTDIPCIAFPVLPINFVPDFSPSLPQGWLKTSNHRVFEQVEQRWDFHIPWFVASFPLKPARLPENRHTHHFIVGK